MTTTVFTSNLESNSFSTSRKLFNHDIFQVEVYGEDNESMTFEVMVDSMAAATAEAERMAMENMIDIQYINVTAM